MSSLLPLNQTCGGKSKLPELAFRIKRQLPPYTPARGRLTAIGDWKINFDLDVVPQHEITEPYPLGFLFKA
jgi:actin-related protein